MADGDQVTQKSYAYMREHPDEAPMQFSPESDLEIPETFEGAEGWGEEGRAADETEEQRLAREAAETDAAAQGEPPANEGEETAEEKATREAAEARKPKFDSIEEYDKAYKEAETKMHTATQETKREREAREKVESELAEAKRLLEEAKKPPAEKKEEPPASAEEFDAQFEAVAEAANEEAINAIAALEDPDTYDQEAVKAHNKKVAAAWTRANAKIIKAAKQTSVSPEAVAKIVADQLAAKEEAAKAEKVEADKKMSTDKAAEENARVWKEAIDLAGKSGLDMTEGTAERDLFDIIANRDLAKQEFMKAETPPPLKEQVERVVKQVNERLGKKIDQTDERRRKARKHQEEHQPLIRGGDTKPPGEENLSEPVSLASIRQQVTDRQRARHRGV